MLKFLYSTPKPSKAEYSFKIMHPFDYRKEESARVLQKYKDKVPIILEKSDNSSIPSIDKNKFLMLEDLTVGQFLNMIRKKIKLEPSQSICLLINNCDPPNTGEKLGKVYEKYKDPDGFLYITYSALEVFG